MKVSFEILELIKRYINGMATDEERQSLEQMLVNRPEVKEEFDLTKMLMEQTEEVERERILDVIQSVEPVASDESVIEKTTSSSFFNSKVFWWGLIGLVMLLLSLFWWRSTQVNGQEEEIFAFIEDAYFDPSDGKSFRGTTVSKSNLDKAYRFFENKKYTESLESLNTIPSSDSLYLKALFLQGHNYYKKGNHNQAIEIFDDILSKKEMEKYYPPSFDNLGWTKILALLSLNKNNLDIKKPQLKQAISDFLKTANPLDVYAEHAKDLEKLLDAN